MRKKWNLAPSFERPRRKLKPGDRECVFSRIFPRFFDEMRRAAAKSSAARVRCDCEQDHNRNERRTQTKQKHWPRQPVREIDRPTDTPTFGNPEAGVFCISIVERVPALIVGERHIGE